MIRLARARAVVMLVVVGALATTTTGSADGAEDLAFAEGKWQGIVVYSASGTVADGAVSAQASLDTATFDGDVDGGAMTGTFHASGSGNSQTATGGAALTLVIEGTMAGTAIAPVIDPQSGTLSGTASSGGFTVPIDFSFGPGQLTDVPLTITAASCSQVNGNYVQPVQAALDAASGASISFTATFSAVRTGQSVEGLQEIMAAAQQISDSFAQTGQLDGPGLVQVVAEAEAFSKSLAKAQKCGAVTGGDEFVLVITGIVQQMLELAVTDPTALSSQQLEDLLWIGTQVGVVGQGAFDQQASDKILGEAKSIFAGRLTDAIAAGDKDAILDVQVAAVTMGWPDLEKQAKTAYEALP